MEILDSQIHIWKAHSPERPWPDPNASSQGSEFQEHQLVEAMDDAGVYGAVLVPPSWAGWNNDLGTDAALNHTDRFVVMGRLPIERRHSLDELLRMKSEPGMKGLRFNITRKMRHVMIDGTADWVWPAAEQAGMPIMILPPGSVRYLHKVVVQHPGLRLIIDHMAMTRPTDSEGRADDIDEVVAMAKYPNVAVKASSLPFFSSEAYPFKDLYPYIRKVYDAFGPDRILWGSDLTRLRKNCTYRQSITMFTEEMPWLHGEDLEKVMGGALRKWLDWKRT